MKQTHMILVLFLFLLPHNVFGASPCFDCEKASLWSEKELCKSNSLLELDCELNEAYNLLMTSNISDSEKSFLKRDQLEWIASREWCNSDDESEVSYCLREKYHDRIANLKASLEINSYSAFRIKDCITLEKRQFIRTENDKVSIYNCIVKNAPKQIIEVGEVYFEVYDVLYNGWGPDSIEPIDDNYFTKIVYLPGDFIVHTSEILGYGKTEGGTPYLTVHTKSIDGKLIDGCAHTGGGHCQEINIYTYYEIGEASIESYRLLSHEYFLGHLKILKEYTVIGPGIISELSWDNEKQILSFDFSHGRNTILRFRVLKRRDASFGVCLDDIIVK